MELSFLIGEKKRGILDAVVGGCLAIALMACPQTQTRSDAGVAADSPADDDAADAASVIDASSVDKTKLGHECSATNYVCPENEQCVDFRQVANGDPDLQMPRCTPKPVCSHVTCPTGKVCAIAEGIPLQPSCQ